VRKYWDNPVNVDAGVLARAAATVPDRVAIGDIQRVVNNYLDKEVLDAGASSARYDAQSTIMNQLNATLGQPGDGSDCGASRSAGGRRADQGGDEASVAATHP
jgi:hypothetical protein